MDELRILIADDHPALRRGIRSLLESHPGWSVCAEVSNGREAVEQTGRLAPDVILLDLSMPELNGLQAAKEIVKKDRFAQVLLLTMHGSEQMETEATRFGAKGLVDKSDAHHSLIPTIESLLRNLIHLAGCSVGRDRHIAALLHAPEEEYRVLAPFVAEGLSRGENTIHIIDPPDRDSHLESMARAGVDLARAEAEGKARMVSWKETYLREDRFDQAAMLDLIQQMLRDSAAQGFPLARLVAHMEWALSDRPGVDDLIEYESKVNEVLPNFDDVVICAYDPSKFGSDTMTEVIRTHPALLIGDTLRDNPLYVPPERWTRAG
jgi:DNA-binding NarL/FixJ family response regulator